MVIDSLEALLDVTSADVSQTVGALQAVLGALTGKKTCFAEADSSAFETRRGHTYQRARRRAGARERAPLAAAVGS